MQAIQTKYLSATNTRGSRIKATCDRGSVTIPYSQVATTGEAAHRDAVHALITNFTAEDLAKYGMPIEKNQWNTRFVSGGLPDGTMAHVFVS